MRNDDVEWIPLVYHLFTVAHVSFGVAHGDQVSIWLELHGSLRMRSYMHDASNTNMAAIRATKERVFSPAM
jgi:hypothetical protein